MGRHERRWRRCLGGSERRYTLEETLEALSLAHASHGSEEVQLLVFWNAQLAQDLQSLQWVSHSPRDGTSGSLFSSHFFSLTPVMKFFQSGRYLFAGALAATEAAEAVLGASTGFATGAKTLSISHLPGVAGAGAGTGLGAAGAGAAASAAGLAS